MAWAVLVGAVVFLFALLGVLLQQEAEYISSLWPANAVAIALLNRSRRDLLSGLVGVIGGNLALNLWIGSDILALLGYASINSFEVLAGVLLVSLCLGLPVALKSLRSVGMFILCAGFLVPGLTAFAGAAMGRFVYGAEYWPAWRVWWMADSISVLIFAPLFLVAREAVGSLAGDWRRILELSGLTVATLAITGAVFSSSIFPLAYLTFPFLVVAGMRFGVFGVSLNASVAALVSVWMTIHGVGQVTGMAAAILEVQVFLGVTVMAALAVAAVLGENRATIEKLAVSERRFRELVEHASDAIFVHDMDGNFVDVNYRACKSLGYERDELLKLNVECSRCGYGQSAGQRR
jgi:integral membrane sensor domain MASE1